VRFADTLIAVVATGLIIAGIAGALGFSMAIGAFFAGLAYSRDPAHSRLDESLSLLYELFVPFFFLSVGFSLFPGSLAGALAPTALLALAAVGGKLVGGAGPALPFTTSVGAVAIGVSMVPRAEICLLVAQRAQAMGPDVLPPQGFTALVLTSAITVIAAPVVLRQVLQRMPEPESDERGDQDASAQ
jgi:Kef-type K+ transport system membrane component KefB